MGIINIQIGGEITEHSIIVAAVQYLTQMPLEEWRRLNSQGEMTKSPRINSINAQIIPMDKLAFAQQILLAKADDPCYKAADAIKDAKDLDDEFSGKDKNPGRAEDPDNPHPGFPGMNEAAKGWIKKNSNDEQIEEIPGTKEFIKKNFQEFYQKLQCNFACGVDFKFGEPSKDSEVVLAFFDPSRRQFIKLVKSELEGIPYFELYIPKQD